MPYKYAALVFEIPVPHFENPENAVEIDDGVFLRTRATTFATNDNNFWRAELGRSAWEAISQHHDLVLSAELETIRPEVLDQENQDLESWMPRPFLPVRVPPVNIKPACAS